MVMLQGGAVPSVGDSYRRKAKLESSAPAISEALNGVEGALKTAVVGDQTGLQFQYGMPVESLLYESRKLQCRQLVQGKGKWEIVVVVQRLLCLFVSECEVAVTVCGHSC